MGDVRQRASNPHPSRGQCLRNSGNRRRGAEWYGRLLIGCSVPLIAHKERARPMHNARQSLSVPFLNRVGKRCSFVHWTSPANVQRFLYRCSEQLSNSIVQPCFITAPIHTMKVSCQCGSVGFDTPQSKPLALYHCHCTQCQKQSASAFGTSAIFPAEGIFPLSADLQSKLGVWTRPTKEGRTTDGYFCKACGVRVMHRKRNADGSERSMVCKSVPRLPPL